MNPVPSFRTLAKSVFLLRSRLKSKMENHCSDGGQGFRENAYRATMIVSLIVLISYLVNLMLEEETWKKVGIKGPIIRGSITSALSMLTLGIMNLLMDIFGQIDGMSSAATMSLIVGNLTGYVMDKSLAGNEGWSKSEGGGLGNLTKCFRYGFASVISVSFVRYVLTVLFDMYISFVLIHGMTKGVPAEYKDCGSWKTFFPTFITTIVSLVTFYTYTNESRFRYAIPDSTASPIDSFTMFCFVIMAACMYMNTAVREEKGIHAPVCKFLNVLFAFVTMIFLANAKDGPGDTEVSGTMVWGGFGMFAIIVFSMVSLTFYLFSEGNVTLFKKAIKILLTTLTILAPAATLVSVEAATGPVAIGVFVGLLVITIGYYRSVQSTGQKN